MRTRSSSLPAPAVLVRVLALVVAISLLVPAAAVPAGPVAWLPAAGVTVAVLPAETCAFDAVANTRTCELWAKAGTLGLPGGESVPIWGFAGAELDPAGLPGPLIVANAGENLQVILHNQLDLPTGPETVSLAFPGQSDLIPDLDGVAAPGAKSYTFAVNEPGTYLYEAGLTANGARQVAMGLYGALIVRPSQNGMDYEYPLGSGILYNQFAYDDGNGSTGYDDEAVLVLSEIDPLFNIDPYSFPMHEYAPRYWLINGQVYPGTAAIDTAAGNNVLLRYANAGLMSHWMGLLGVQQRIVGSDGEPRGDLPRRVVAETVASGQTVDALVSVPGDAIPGTRYALYDSNLLLHNANQRLADGSLAFGGMMTFLSAGTGGPPDDGPLATVTLDPTNTTGDAGVILTVLLDDASSGGQNVEQAEYFIDTVGDPTTGTPITVDSPAPVVTLIEPITPAILDALASGQHIFYARGKDALGNWGPLGSAALNLDKTGPAVTGLSLSPDPSNGTSDVTLSATGDDQGTGGNNVVDGEYSLDGGTLWEKMVLDRTDAPITAMTAELLSTALPIVDGLYPIQVRAQDSLFTWGDPSVIALTLDMTGPEAPGVTLAPPELNFSLPLDLPTHVRLTAFLTDALFNEVQSTLANAESFIGPAGDPGTGFALFPSDGLFDEVSETAYFDIPVSSFSQLVSGTHPVTVRGLDAAGNWGAVGSADITIIREATGADTEGPVITAVDVSPNPTNGATQLNLQAVAVDQTSNIAAGEWYVVGDDPDPGDGVPLDAFDTAFDSPSELMIGTIVIDEAGWPKGRYGIAVRAQDSSGNWGDITVVTVRVKW